MHHLSTKLALASALCCTFAATSQAAWLTDNFDDGDRTNNPSWFLAKAESSAPVVNDAVFGSNAMQFNNEHSGSDPVIAPWAQKGVAVAFPQLQLQVGESVVLSFDFRLQSLVSQSGLLRFGIGRNAVDPAFPTPFTADGTANGSSAGDDDPFYVVAISTGANSTVTIREDNGTINGFLSGSDFAGDKGSGNFTLNDTAAHQFEFTVERISDTENELTVDIDGGTVASGIDNFNLKTILDEIGLVSNHRDLDFVVDNLVLTYNQGPPPLDGDLDGDGFVGIDDLNLVLGNWNQNVPPGDPLADPSGDGFVGIDDLNTVLGNWNAGTPPASSAVPEPASLALLGLGGLVVLRRR